MTAIKDFQASVTPTFPALFTDTYVQFDAYLFKLATEAGWPDSQEAWKAAGPLPRKCESVAVSLFVLGKSDARLRAALSDLHRFGRFYFADSV